MTFYNHSLKAPHTLRDGREILRRNRARIEEAARVVELDLAGFYELPQREVDLLRDRARRNGFGQRIFPEIAHQTAPRAFAIRQKDRCDANDFARLRALVFHEKCGRFSWIDSVPHRTPRENPFVAFARRIGINAHA